MGASLIKGWWRIQRELGIDQMQVYALGFAIRDIRSFEEWAVKGGMPVWYLHDIDDEPRIFRGELMKWARQHDAAMGIPKYSDEEKERAWAIIRDGMVKTGHLSTEGGCKCQE